MEMRTFLQIIATIGAMTVWVWSLILGFHHGIMAGILMIILPAIGQVMLAIRGFPSEYSFATAGVAVLFFILVCIPDHCSSEK